MQKGFTLIELMVVIVIIGILSALAIPKMFGVSAKAKAAEAPNVIANWETLNSAYAQETGTGGVAATIGFQIPVSKWFTYTTPSGAQVVARIPGTSGVGFGSCTAATQIQSDYTAATDVFVHVSTLAVPCKAYIPNF